MRHGSLFSGIGGFDLAAEWMGWDNIFQVENNPWCQKILKKNFPNARRYEDIREFTGRRGRVDILTGGFPCQPFSQAGKRKGTRDDRNLWPEYFRVIREIQPTYVVGENVAGLLTMDDGKVFDGILSDLESEGYQVESFLIPACGVEAWHRRERVWVVGYSPSARSQKSEAGKFQIPVPHVERTSTQESSRGNSNTSRSNSNSDRSHRTQEHQHGRTEQGGTELQHQQEREPGQMCENVSDPTRQLPHGSGRTRRRGTKSTNSDKNVSNTSGNDVQGVVPRTQSGEHGRSLGLYDRERSGERWDVEPAVGRVAHGIPNRVDRLKGLGNAIVPQVAYEIFKAIQIHFEMITKEQLVSAVEDLNNILFEEDSKERISTNQSKPALINEIKSAALWIYATDNLQEETVEVLKSFEWNDSDFENLDADQNPKPAFYRYGILTEDKKEEEIAVQEQEELPEESDAEEPVVQEHTTKAPPKKKEKKEPSAYGTALALMGPDPNLPIGDLYDLMKAHGFDIQKKSATIKTAHSIARKMYRIYKEHGHIKEPAKKKK